MRDIQLLPSSRIAVLGAGVEGRAVLDYLDSLGCRDVTVCDKDEGIQLPDGVKPRLGDDYLAELDRFDIIFRSPGVPRDLAGLQDAERAGAVITSATKEFFRRCPCTIVGITGSNGKTTTTSLIADLLRTLYGDGLHVGGNDREPLLRQLSVIQRDHVAVVELSSFQLQDLSQSPHVAVVLNITPNHLDVHPTLEEYRDAKSQIVRHQTPADYSVLNWSSTRVRELAGLTPAHVVYFNQREAQEGAFLHEGRIHLRHAGAEEVLMAADGVPFLTNVDNVLAAAMVAKLFGIEAEVIRSVLHSFRPAPHRMQLVRELDGVRYFDDSASTTPESTLTALHAFTEGKVVLIAGGSDKRLGFELLGSEIVRTKSRAVLIGQTRERIAEAVRAAAERMNSRGHVVELAATLEEAVAQARRIATPGDAVVLSPACASFDMFRNAKHRGDRFQEVVRELAPAGDEGTAGA